MARIKLEFEGLDAMLDELKQLEGDVKQATNAALQEVGQYVTEQAETAIQPHHRTGKTEKSLLKTPNVEWAGDTATVHVGFDIANGGLASIFLMYGTPRVKKDTKLYNAFYGKQTQKHIEEIERKAFEKAIEQAGG